MLYTTCKTCSGSGQINPNPCKCCSGKGLQHKKTSIDVDIPPGISEDLNLSVPGAGHKHGRKIGDLIVHFKVFLELLFSNSNFVFRSVKVINSKGGNLTFSVK